MSVLVKGMEMPKNCHECPLEYWETCFVFPIENVPVKSLGRPEWCPLEEVKEEKNEKSN